MMEEIWKNCISFSGWEVSNLGRVRRKPFNNYDFIALKHVSSDGYYYPKLRGKKGYYKCFGQTDTYLVHRAVAEAFIPNPQKLPCVNHIDGNKENNIISNLEWVTHKQNSQHAVKTGLISSGENSHLFGKTGDQHPCYKSLLGNNWNIGRRASEETKQKISQKLKGNKNNLGHKHTEETRRKLSIKAKEREARKRLLRQNGEQ